MRLISCLVDQHDYVLTLLAAAICLVGSAVTINMFRRVRAAASSVRAIWSFLGGIAGGATIWCTHFVAMMAYRPGVEVAYAPLLTGLSLALAALGCTVAMGLGARRDRKSPAVGGAVFGLSVAAMHYTGMAAFTAEAVVYWSAAYVTASIVAAVIAEPWPSRSAPASCRGRAGTSRPCCWC